jgi:hypothetical protein
MTVTLDLNADQEKSLRVAAEARGVDADTLAKEVMRKFLEEQFADPSNATSVQRAKGSGRLLGLNAMGVEWVSDDFDEPLSDSFWLGTE